MWPTAWLFGWASGWRSAQHRRIISLLTDFIHAELLSQLVSLDMT